MARVFKASDRNSASASSAPPPDKYCNWDGRKFDFKGLTLQPVKVEDGDEGIDEPSFKQEEQSVWPEMGDPLNAWEGFTQRTKNSWKTVTITQTSHSKLAIERLSIMLAPLTAAVDASRNRTVDKNTFYRVEVPGFCRIKKDHGVRVYKHRDIEAGTLYKLWILLSILLKNVKNFKIQVTCRNLFYRGEELFGASWYRDLRPLLWDIAFSCGVSRHDLNVVADGYGSFFGDLIFDMRDGTSVVGSRSRSQAVPCVQDVRRIRFPADVRFLVILEAKAHGEAMARGRLFDHWDLPGPGIFLNLCGNLKENEARCLHLLTACMPITVANLFAGDLNFANYNLLQNVNHGGSWVFNGPQVLPARSFLRVGLTVEQAKEHRLKGTKFNRDDENKSKALLEDGKLGAECRALMQHQKRYQIESLSGSSTRIKGLSVGSFENFDPLVNFTVALVKAGCASVQSRDVPDMASEYQIPDLPALHPWPIIPGPVIAGYAPVGRTCPEKGCKFYYQLDAELTTHLFNIHKVQSGDAGGKFRCPDPKCGQLYTRKDNLNRHIRDVHGDGSTRLQCMELECPETFARHHDLKRHYERFHGGVPVPSLEELRAHSTITEAFSHQEEGGVKDQLKSEAKIIVISDDDGEQPPLANIKVEPRQQKRVRTTRWDRLPSEAEIIVISDSDEELADVKPVESHREVTVLNDDMDLGRRKSLRITRRAVPLEYLQHIGNQEEDDDYCADNNDEVEEDSMVTDSTEEDQDNDDDDDIMD